MTAHLDQLASLAASLPPGAVLAHLVTRNASMVPWPSRVNQRAWAKIGDEAWRSVSSVEWRRHPFGERWAELGLTWDPEGCDWDSFRVVTGSVVWEQDYGLRGRHEVMGVVG